MISLVGTLSVYGEALEADFAEVYGLDLAETLAQGRWAKVKRLITQLPAASRFVINVSRGAPDDGKAPDLTWWHRTDRLLATIIDQLTIANWQRSGGKKKPELLTDPPPPPTKPRVKLDQEKVRAHLRAIGPQKAAS